MMYIDLSVYPDLTPPPDELVTPGDKADYVQRICAAWDFGIVPEAGTFELLRGWRAVFDHYPLPSSPTYHAFRSWFGWPPAEKDLQLESPAERIDRLEGRPQDSSGDFV